MNITERIVLTTKEQATIKRWSQGKSIALRLVQRVRIIQLAAEGVYNHEIAKRLNISRPTVQLWRERFLAFRLSGLEKDAPRPGRFPKVSHKKVMAIKQYIESHNQNPKVFVWTASVETIMKKISKCKDLLETAQ